MQEKIENILAVLNLTPIDGVMIVIGTVLIFALYKTLETQVFRPLLEHVEQRESVTAGALFTADQMRQKASALRTRYDDAMFQARVEANKTRSDVVRDAKTKASQIVAKAEAEAAESIKAGRIAITEQLKRAQSSAETEAKELASRLASQVDSQLSLN
jgi:F0F1-type ATP synthase membrane subunit b/b'